MNRRCERRKGLLIGINIKTSDTAYSIYLVEALLAQQSEFFDRALGGYFIEAQTSEIALPEHYPFFFKYTLHYIFSGDLGLVFSRMTEQEDINKLNSGDFSPNRKARALTWRLCRMFFYADTLLMDGLNDNMISLLTACFDYLSRNYDGYNR